MKTKTTKSNTTLSKYQLLIKIQLNSLPLNPNLKILDILQALFKTTQLINVQHVNHKRNQEYVSNTTQNKSHLICMLQTPTELLNFKYSVLE